MSFYGGEIEYDSTSQPESILELIRCSRTQQQGYIRKRLNLQDCRNYTYTVKEWGNMEEIHIAPDVQVSTDLEHEWSYRKAYTYSHDIKTNKVYTFEGVTCAEPHTQHVTQLFEKYTPVISSLENFFLTEDDKKKRNYLPYLTMRQY
jgi:proteasome assembly chaperone (PAC2) family protein